MSAEVLIKKYTGKDGDFGTPVKSIGIKRIDSCAQSVYSSSQLEGTGHTIPADDASDAQMYCVYRPDKPDCYAYSMESVFKIHLIKAPDVQLSNIRIYPIGDRPTSPHAAKLYIGNSINYTRPTNQKSLVAVNDIWDYDREHPFYLTVSGMFGQIPDPRLGKTEYVVDYKDCGYGNLIYIDNVRQPLLPVATRTDDNEKIVLTFKNRVNDNEHFIDFVAIPDRQPFTPGFVPVAEFTQIPDEYIQHDVIDGMKVTKLVVYDPDLGLDLMAEYPSGIVYKIPPEGEEGSISYNPNFNTGHLLIWARLNNGTKGIGSTSFVPSFGAHQHFPPAPWTKIDVDENTGIVEYSPDKPPYTPVEGEMLYSNIDPVSGKEIVYYDVEVQTDPICGLCYYFNGVRRPMLTFDLNKLYRIANRSGSNYPLRFIGNVFSPIANYVDDVVVDGITVEHGATNSEVILVNPEKILKSGKIVNAYQAVTAPGLGSYVFNNQLCMCGEYNLCKVDGGIYNPLNAGETDYVYLQMEVDGMTDPGFAVPNLAIEYDEN